MNTPSPSQTSASGFRVSLDRSHVKRFLVALIAFECVLVGIFAFDTAFDHGMQIVSDLFDLDGETTIPAWFSAMQLAVIGLVFMLKALQPSSSTPLFLLVVGAGFLFLSADEGAAIHEKVSAVLAERTEWLPRFRFGHGVWIFVYLAGAVAILLPFHRQIMAIWHEYRSEASLMASGMALAVAGGVGLEIIAYEFLGATLTPRLYPIEVAAEEFLEMLGMSVVLYGSLLMLLRDEPYRSGPVQSEMGPTPQRKRGSTTISGPRS